MILCIIYIWSYPYSCLGSILREKVLYMYTNIFLQYTKNHAIADYLNSKPIALKDFYRERNTTLWNSITFPWHKIYKFFTTRPRII